MGKVADELRVRAAAQSDLEDASERGRCTCGRGLHAAMATAYEEAADLIEPVEARAVPVGAYSIDTERWTLFLCQKTGKWQACLQNRFPRVFVQGDTPNQAIYAAEEAASGSD